MIEIVYCKVGARKSHFIDLLSGNLVVRNSFYMYQVFLCSNKKCRGSSINLFIGMIILNMRAEIIFEAFIILV